MTRTTGKRGFTLIELLVVIGMIALITGAVSTSMSSAMQRARIQKAESEVKIIAQAALSYSNFNDLPEMSSWTVVDASRCSFLLTKGKSDANTEIPVLIQAALSSSGVMRDPWGMPYKLMITKGSISSQTLGPLSSLQTGYYLPNFYRLTAAERGGKEGGSEK